MLIDSFPEAVKPFLEYLLYELNRSEKTIVAYGTDLKDFERYLKETDALLDLTKASADNVRNWMVRLIKIRGRQVLALREIYVRQQSGNKIEQRSKEIIWDTADLAAEICNKS